MYASLVLYSGDRMRRASKHALLHRVLSRCLRQAARLEEQEDTYMYAVIKTGGKQYKVAVGDEIFVE